MSQDLPDVQLLRELEPVVEKNINRHLAMRKDWNPHDYIPWSDGKNFYALGGQDWDPEQSKLSEVAQTAMVQNLLTEDNLPSYHREIAMNFTMDGPWGWWVNRWTAEENRHGIALRDYLLVTRAIDPVELEELRVEQVTRGFSPGQNQQGPPRGTVVRGPDLQHRVPGHPAGHGKDEKRHREPGQRLGLAVAVGVVLVGRPRRHAETRPHEDRGQDVEHRLRGVGDERVGVAEDATSQLHGGEQGVQPDAAQHQARAGFGAGADGGCGGGRGQTVAPAA